MFGPDPTAITASTGTGPSMHAASKEAQNSARTVPPCTYPITQWSATARLVPGVEVVPLLDGLLRRRVRVMPVAHHERRPVHREAPDAPAPGLMAVVPPRVHPRVRQQAPGDHQDTEDPRVEVVERAAVRAEVVRHSVRAVLLQPRLVGVLRRVGAHLPLNRRLQQGIRLRVVVPRLIRFPRPARGDVVPGCPAPGAEP